MMKKYKVVNQYEDLHWTPADKNTGIEDKVPQLEALVAYEVNQWGSKIDHSRNTIDFHNTSWCKKSKLR